MPTFSIFPRSPEEGKPALRGQILLDRRQLESVNIALAILEDDSAKGISIAMDRAAAQIREHLIDSVAARVFLPRPEIASCIQTKKADKKGESYIELKVIDKAEPLIRFQVEQTEIGVEANIFRDDGPRFIQSGFIQKMPDGRIGVFQRKKWAGRYPIIERYGPSVRAIIQTTPGFLDEQKQWATDELVFQIEKIAHEMLNESIGANDSPSVARFIGSSLLNPFKAGGQLGDFFDDLTQDVSRGTFFSAAGVETGISFAVDEAAEAAEIVIGAF